MQLLSILISCFFAGEVAAVSDLKDATSFHGAGSLTRRALKSTGSKGSTSRSSSGLSSGSGTSSSTHLSGQASSSRQLPTTDKLSVRPHVRISDLVNNFSDTSSSSGSSGKSSPLITPESSPRGSTTSSFARKPQRPISILPGHPIALPKKPARMSITSLRRPEIKSARNPTEEPQPVAKVKDAKVKMLTVGPGRVEAMKNFEFPKGQTLQLGEYKYNKLRNMNMVSQGGRTQGGRVMGQARGHFVALDMETGPSGRGYYEDLRDPNLKHRRIEVGPNEKVEKDIFPTGPGSTAKARVVVEGQGTVNMVGSNLPTKDTPQHIREMYGLE